jgi:hypothetical protein
MNIEQPTDQRRKEKSQNKNLFFWYSGSMLKIHQIHVGTGTRK